MNVAHIEFNDGELITQLRGYQESQYDHFGVVHFVWDGEFLTFPMHRIRSIAETIEADQEVQGHD